MMPVRDRNCRICAHFSIISYITLVLTIDIPRVIFERQNNLILEFLPPDSNCIFVLVEHIHSFGLSGNGRGMKGKNRLYEGAYHLQQRNLPCLRLGGGDFYQETPLSLSPLLFIRFHGSFPSQQGECSLIVSTRRGAHTNRRFIEAT